MERTTSTPGITRSAPPICPQCDADSVRTKWIDHTMKWGSGDQAADIPVTMPVRICDACDLEYFDQHGERLRHRAICRHFGVLPPEEIRAIRKTYGMSRASFAKVTGLGEATIGRWENGLVIQNVANDRYLRLVATPHVMRMLRRLAMSTTPVTQAGEGTTARRFRRIKPTSKLRRDQERFHLRLAS